MSPSSHPGTKSTNYRKYQSTNPAVRWVLDRFLREVVETVGDLHPVRIVDLGCGEGMVAGRLHRSLPGVEYLGVDVDPDAVDLARTLYPEVEFRVGSLFDPPPDDVRADLVLCLEVIEHLQDPHTAVEHVLDWTERDALFSVPWEPFFRLGNLLRGRHLRAWGNHPEHVQQFGPRSFSRLLHSHAPEVEVWSRFPWLLGRVRLS